MNVERSSRVDRVWYRACLDCIDELDRHTEHRDAPPEAFASWCELCAIAGEALNAEDAFDELDIDYLNGTPLARWLLRRFDRRMT